MRGLTWIKSLLVWLTEVWWRGAADCVVLGLGGLVLYVGSIAAIHIVNETIGYVGFEVPFFPDIVDYLRANWYLGTNWLIWLPFLIGLSRARPGDQHPFQRPSPPPPPK